MSGSRIYKSQIERALNELVAEMQYQEAYYRHRDISASKTWRKARIMVDKMILRLTK